MRYIQGGSKLFLHVPKTGGVSVEHVMDSNFETITVPQRWGKTPGRHALKDHLLHHLFRCSVIDERPWTFTFVRHPVDWYVSCWRYLHDVKRKRERKGSTLAGHTSGFRWHPYKCLIKLWDDDFEKWMRRVLLCQPTFVTRLFELYCGPEGNETVDYVGRCETLGKDLQEIFPGTDPPPEKNKSEHLRPTAIPNKLWGQIGDGEVVALDRFYGSLTEDFRHARDWRNA